MPRPSTPLCATPPTPRPWRRLRAPHVLACAALLLGPQVATAALVTYTVQGTFTGVATGDSVLSNAVNPLVGGQAVRVSFTLDTGAQRTIASNGDTVYSAVTASSVSFANYGNTSLSCPSVSEFICKVRVREGTGVPFGTGADQFNLFSAPVRSGGLESDAGLLRPLDLQFNVFFTDFSGAALSDDGLDFDLTTAALPLFTARMSVFAFNASTLGRDRADFAFNVTGITSGSGTPLPAPEPGSLALAALGLAALGAGQRRRSGQGAPAAVFSRGPRVRAALPQPG